MKKILLLYAAMIFISAIFMQNSLPGKGLLGLINGVNIRNNVILVSSDFLFASLVIFNMFGKCEKYLYGYGKYKLLRYKSRKVILYKIIAKSFLSISLLVLFRVSVYSFLLLVRNKKMIDTSITNILNYLILSILSLTCIILIQFLIELKFSSFAGLITSFSYYVISIMLGGYFLEKEKYSLLLFLVPNYSMKNRTDLITQNYIDFYILYLILLFSIIICVLLCKRIMMYKDVF